eukprot:365778-Chlamydomonas_euryale.AAC.16
MHAHAPAYMSIDTARQSMQGQLPGRHPDPQQLHGGCAPCEACRCGSMHGRQHIASFSEKGSDTDLWAAQPVGSVCEGHAMRVHVFMHARACFQKRTSCATGGSVHTCGGRSACERLLCPCMLRMLRPMFRMWDQRRATGCCLRPCMHMLRMLRPMFRMWDQRVATGCCLRPGGPLAAACARACTCCAWQSLCVGSEGGHWPLPAPAHACAAPGIQNVGSGG